MSELEDHVEQICAAVEALGDVIGDGPRTRKLVDSLFRKVHNFKAAAAAAGLQKLSAMAHEFENELHSLRTGKTTLDDDALKLLTETSDAIFENLPADKPARLPGSDRIPDEIWNSLKEVERHRLFQSLDEGANLFLVQTSFDVADFEQQFHALKETLSKTGELISTAPKVDQERAGKINFRILYARAAEGSEIINELTGVPGVSVTAIDIPAPAYSAPGKAARADSVRINLEALDHIIDATHKLCRQTVGAVNDAKQTAALERSFLELSGKLVNLRLVPIGRVLQRGLRAGRFAANATGKEVEIVLRGIELLLDQSIAEAIADPLVHLVRNAVDHGIESPADRRKLGKNPRGTITIEAATFQGQVRIVVKDDGRGLDPAIIAEAAKRLGVVAPKTFVKSEQCVRLLFRPGFSTALEVSGVSGRGVGLDVVETEVEQLGGSVRVASEMRQSCSFEIRLPLTFGLLDIVIVTVSGRRYLIDADQVDLNAKSDGSAVKLSTLLGHETVVDRPERVLVCRFGKQPALLVDEVAEPQQALIRSLGSRGGRWFGIAGAAELRDGTVALLLDLPRLLGRRPGQP